MGGGQRESRGRKRARGSAGDTRAPPPVVTDPRFAALHWDPRFARVPVSAKKTRVDARFRDALAANPHFQGSAAPVDRFGRARNPAKKDAALARLLDTDPEEERPNDAHPAVDTGDPGESAEKPSDDAAPRGKPGEAPPVPRELASDSEASSESSEDGPGEPREENEPGVLSSAVAVAHAGFDSDQLGSSSDEDISEEEPEPIVRGEATKRLAVMGLDWSSARAIDIFACLQSFCPPGKLLKEVHVHQTKFGMERLAKESMLGPQLRGTAASQNGENALSHIEGETADDGQHKGVDHGHTGFGPESCNPDGNHDESSDEADDAENTDDDYGSIHEDAGYSSSDGGDDVAETALDADARAQDEQDAMRKYEEERLKYFFALAVFDEVKTADTVYDQCDGVEFQSTGLAMDLRFVPDDMVIDRPVRDAATSVPDGYAPPNSVPSTLNNSKVKLSWDADAPDRAVLKKRKFGRHEEDEANLKAYLASASESEDDDAKDGASRKSELEKKRRLLLGGPSTDVDGEQEDEEMEMEVTFEPGLLEKGQDIVKRKEVREAHRKESEWEARLRRMQERKAEKRKARKEELQKRARGSADAEKAASDDSDGIYGGIVDSAHAANDPFFSSALSEEELRDLKKQKRNGKDAKHKRSRITGQPADDTPDVSDIGEHGKEKARQEAALELLMMDDGRPDDSGCKLRKAIEDADSDDDDERHGKSRNLKAKSKRRTRGRRRGQCDALLSASAEDEVASSKLDVNDSRFSSLFSSHLFAMDPTHPKFKRNATTERIMHEKARRGDSGARPTTGGVRGSSEEKPPDTNGLDRHGKGDGDLLRLAASVKAKSAAARSKRRKVKA